MYKFRNIIQFYSHIYLFFLWLSFWLSNHGFTVSILGWLMVNGDFLGWHCDGLRWIVALVVVGFLCQLQWIVMGRGLVVEVIGFWKIVAWVRVGFFLWVNGRFLWVIVDVFESWVLVAIDAGMGETWRLLGLLSC